MEVASWLRKCILSRLHGFDVHFWDSKGTVPTDLRDTNVLVTFSADHNILNSFPRLRLLQVWGAGTDRIDVQAAADLGIRVMAMEGAAARAIAEWVVLMVLFWERNLALWTASGASGTWTWAERYALPFSELTARTLGIVGCGPVGSEVARVASLLSMRVLAVRVRKELPAPPGVTLLGGIDSLPNLLSRADYLSLHCRLSEETRGLIDMRALSFMPRSAVLLNAARGELVVEKDLAVVLRHGRIRGASLDTTAIEPLPPESLLIGIPNIVITCHQAGFTNQAVERGLLILKNNIVHLIESEGSAGGRQ